MVQSLQTIQNFVGRLLGPGKDQNTFVLRFLQQRNQEVKFLRRRHHREEGVRHGLRNRPAFSDFDNLEIL